MATNEIERSALDKKAIILNHIVPEIKETSDMQNNMVLIYLYLSIYIFVHLRSHTIYMYLMFASLNIK